MDELESDDAADRDEEVDFEGKAAVAVIRTFRPLSSKCFTRKMALPCIYVGPSKQISKDTPQFMK